MDVFDLTQVKGKMINSVRTYVSDYHDHCQQTFVMCCQQTFTSGSIIKT